jgi:hypothetical protein
MIARDRATMHTAVTTTTSLHVAPLQSDVLQGGLDVSIAYREIGGCTLGPCYLGSKVGPDSDSGGSKKTSRLQGRSIGRRHC